MADNKVKFLRGTADEYAAAEKDNDTIYFTTDDGKLYIGDKEITNGGSITIDNALSDTSENALQNKVIKAALDEKASKALYDNTTINVGRRANTTVGDCSTAEGNSTTASGVASHAEGISTTASKTASHAEGANTTASGNQSHAGGHWSEAMGYTSFAHGCHVIANNDYEVTFGRHNSSNSDTLFSIGDGSGLKDQHNAFEITTDGGKLHDKDIATIDDIPESLPANGGNADTVNNHTVDTDVPADAVFTDTIYNLPIATTTVLGGVKVDGTTITADGNGVISAVGGGSSGSGGSGIGLFSGTVLYEATSMEANLPIGTLNDDVRNYDYIYLNALTEVGVVSGANSIVLSSALLPTSCILNIRIQIAVGSESNITRHSYFKINSNGRTLDELNKVRYISIRGIKL